MRLLIILSLGVLASIASAQTPDDVRQSCQEAKTAYLAFTARVKDRPAGYYAAPIPQDSSWLKFHQQQIIQDIELANDYMTKAQYALRLMVVLGYELQEPDSLTGKMQPVFDFKICGAYVDSVYSLVQKRSTQFMKAVHRFKKGNDAAVKKFLRD